MEEVVSDVPRRSERERKLTERMAEYNKNEYYVRENQLIKLYEGWRTLVKEGKQIFRNNCIEELGSFIDSVQDVEKNIICAFEHCRKVGIPDSKIVRKVDACSAITKNLVKIAVEKIANVDEFENEDVLKSLYNNEYAGSVFSSNESQVSLKIADAAADYAAKKAEYDAIKAKENYEIELEKLQEEHRKNIELKQRELRKLEAESSMRVAEARLKVFEQYVDQPTSVHSSNCVKPEQIPTVAVQSNMPNYNIQSTVPPHNNLAQHADIDSIVKALSNSVNLNRLPIPEPSVFTGDPLDYIEWKQSFTMLIEHKGVSDQEKIYYLKKYVGHPARKALEGFFYSNSVNAFENAKRVLDERYGHPFVLQKAYRDRLNNWPKIGSKNPSALRDFSDFLQGCKDAMQFVPSLSILNDCSENQRLLGKLPDWVSLRWNRVVSERLDSTGLYPVFVEFVDFVAKEARIACNPVSSLSVLQNLDKEQKTSVKSKNVSVKVLTTNASDQLNQTDSNNNVKSCHYCERTDHYIFKCDQFLSLSIEDKRSFIREKKLCYGCLRIGHTNKDCRKKHTCGVCKGKHPTCLHEDRFTRNFPSQNQNDIAVASSFHVSNSRAHGTSMIVPVWISSNDNVSNEVLTYALLDTQSDTTFLLNDTAEALHIHSEPVRLSLSTMTSRDSVITSKRIKNLKVRNFYSSDSVSIDLAYTRDFIPADRTHIPTQNTAMEWDHLNCLAKELPPLQSCEVGLLIGYNCPQALAPQKVLTGIDNQPYAVQTLLGWSIIGNSTSPMVSAISHRTSVKELPPYTPRDVIKVLESDFAHDRNDDVKLSQNEIQFLNFLEANVQQQEDGHVVMPLPFKERPTLPNNKSLALLRLGHLKRKLTGDKRYHEHYNKFMNDIISRGDAELVKSEGVSGNEWYIPHHGVYHPRKPDKIRVVFDCSVRYKDTTLNQHLLTGPDLTNELAGVLCRFRQHPIAIMCDIERMFHQFLVPSTDRNFLRFLWWEDGDITTKPLEYRMRVHLFGAASSPGCANYGLKYLAKNQSTVFPCASEFIQNDFYVDDGLTSVRTENEACSLINDARQLCLNGGIRLHKFISNNKNVIKSVPVSERSVNLKDLEQLPVQQTLGVNWDIERDVFNFKCTVSDMSCTRRNMLSIVASILDPLGFLSPFTLIGKRLLQETCKTGSGWDDSLSIDRQPDWKNWCNDFKIIQQLEISRCLVPKDFDENSRIELHHFSDASTSGYGQCSYLRIVNDCEVKCSFLMGKARVAPLKVVTIPRLELTAAVLSVKISAFLRKELTVPIQDEYFWTDSRVVLAYINNEARRFHTFVCNCVQLIRNATKPTQWFYVDSRNNPADHASRGLNAREITSSTWLCGPSFLLKPNLEPNRYNPELVLGDPEVKSTRSMVTMTTSTPCILDLLSKISSWSRVISVLARLMRLSNGIKGIYSPNVEERVKAEMTLISLVQHCAFTDLFKVLRTSSKLPKTNSLYCLDPILLDGILRVGGRLRKADLPCSFKHPVILPRDSHFSKLIIAQAHADVHHQGRGITLNRLRSMGYWIVGGSKLIASFIRYCVVCRKLRRPTETQKMADLPKDRVEPSPPFLYCGMDCFGPFNVKNGRTETKRYGLIITCMCFCAIHIEMLDDMSTDSFINSLRCFIAIRGAVRQLRSDQGSNFIGAKNEFLKGRVDTDKLTSFLAEKQCDFLLNVPDASHTGGVWERQIRTVRDVLNSILGNFPGRLDDLSLRTVFYEVMSIVNCRPLTVSEIDDPKTLEPLTPNHILTSKCNVPYPIPGEYVKEDMYLRKRWRRVQYLLEQFWSRWKKEYMAQISLRQQWHEPRRNIRIGDIVLVKDINFPRNQWPLAKVVQANPDDDGLVRRVFVKLGRGGILERSVHKLVLIVES
ncbi:hypothetical protein ACF0H5_010832 [Mactra antiquata]